MRRTAEGKSWVSGAVLGITIMHLITRIPPEGEI